MGKKFKCLTKCKENISKAYCTICSLSFKVVNSGVAQVRVYAGTDCYKGRKSYLWDTVILSSNVKISSDSNKNILLST